MKVRTSIITPYAEFDGLPSNSELFLVSLNSQGLAIAYQWFVQDNPILKSIHMSRK